MGHFIFVAGADTPAGGANLGVPFGPLPCQIQALVVRHNNVGLFTQLQIVRADFDPLGLQAVDSLDVENPPSGFCIDPQRLPHPAVTADFVTRFAAILDGQHAEYATLVVNGSRRIRLDVDARSFVQGHLEVELPEPPGAELLAEAKQRYEV